MITTESDEIVPALNTLTAKSRTLWAVSLFGRTVRKDGRHKIKRWRGKEYMV